MNDHARKIIVAATAVTLGFALVLWSWNTLAGLFGLPTADARHVLATFVLLETIRFALAGRRHWPCRGTYGSPRHDH